MGKNALVVGVANNRSLAWGIARGLYGAGADLFLTYQGERVKDSVLKLTEQFPRRPLTEKLDVDNENDLQRVFDRIASEMGGLDILVHSIAYAPKEALEGRFLDTSRDVFLQTLDISAYSLVKLVQHAEPLMEARGGGAVLALTYLGGERVIPNYNVMGIAKAALDHIVRYLAVELGPKGIRVNALSSGPVSTASSRAIHGFMDMHRAVRTAAPTRRGTTLEDLGNTAVFYCNPAAAQITGEIVHVDGGYNLLGIDMQKRE